MRIENGPLFVYILEGKSQNRKREEKTGVEEDRRENWLSESGRVRSYISENMEQSRISKVESTRKFWELEFLAGEPMDWT